MGNRPRSQSERHHEHTDFAGEVRYVGEEGLYSLIEKSTRPPLVLIIDGVQDPHNLGACLRTADAAGATGVIIPKDRSTTVTPAARSVACGAAESVPIARVTNLARCLRQLKELGLWLVGTGDEEDRTLYEVDLTGPLGIIIGAEGKGVRRLTRDLCDHLVSIPMLGKVSCLNLSVAAGVTLFEAVRQRQAKRQ